jgi:hypothetical protein
MEAGKSSDLFRVFLFEFSFITVSHEGFGTALAAAVSGALPPLSSAGLCWIALSLNADAGQPDPP